MTVLNESLLLGDEASGGYKIERSLRFNSADSAYLSRTPASAGNRKIFTWAGWVKRTKLWDGSSGADVLFQVESPSYNRLLILFDKIYWDSNQIGYSGTSSIALLRDTSAWYHIVVSIDTTQAVAANRIKFYVNGTQTERTAFHPDLNHEFYINNNVTHYIQYAPSSAIYGSAYLADIHFIDGQALTPSSFGEFDVNNVWQPKAYTGSYGTNGFHLDFSDNSTAAALGTDTSGNGNTWTVNNISIASGNGSYISSTTGTTSPAGTSFGNMFDGNTSTFVRAAPISTVTFTKTFTGVTTLRVYASRLGGNLRVNGTAVPNGINGTWWSIDLTSIGSTITDISFTSGPNPNLFEVYAIEVNGAVLVDNVFNSGNDSLVDSPTNYGTDTGAGGEVRGNYCTLNPLQKDASIVLKNGNLDFESPSGWRTGFGTIAVSSGKWYWEHTIVAVPHHAGIATASHALDTYLGAGTGVGYNHSGIIYVNGGTGSTFASYGANDVIGVALNMDAGTIQFYKNGTLQGTGATGLAGTYFPAYSANGAGTGAAANFGQRPFAYPAPSGFKALCTTNLPAPTITKPSTAMDVKLYTGNGSTQTISGLGFSPDFVWLKARSAGYSHQLYDQIRGAGKLLNSNSTNAETTVTDNLTAFTGSGFTLGNDAGTNQSSATYVGWTWDAGSSTVTNTSGTITSQVRANASAGFSVVTYNTGSTANQTIGHGLGVSPSLIIAKSRTGGSGWPVYHASAGAGYLDLSDTAAFASNTNYWGTGTVINSSVFGVGNVGFWNNTGGMVAYCFAPVAGYSAFGKYTGNGSADGPFVYTGFRPRFVLIKTITSGSAHQWRIHDTARDTYNAGSYRLYPNSSFAENGLGGEAYTTNHIDILSNGFKLRSSNGETNYSTWEYIYAAFAEAPFALARAR